MEQLDTRLEATILLCHVLGCNTAHLVAWPEKELDQAQQQQFEQLVSRRRHGIPIAHLTGRREFWSLDFLVDDSTLIPRPETETLVEFILQQFSADTKIRLLDLGTGSGAIAIAIASERPRWQIIASDRSADALALATRNCDQLHTKNVQLLQSDWFDNITQKDFDIIVSNPPYIAEDDPHLAQGDVRFEPHSALTAGKTGMDDIERLCQQAGEFLIEDGWLILEHGYDQQDAVYRCFEANGFRQITQQQDLSEQPRMTAAQRPGR